MLDIIILRALIHTAVKDPGDTEARAWSARYAAEPIASRRARGGVGRPLLGFPAFGCTGWGIEAPGHTGDKGPAMGLEVPLPTPLPVVSRLLSTRRPHRVEGARCRV